MDYWCANSLKQKQHPQRIILEEDGLKELMTEMQESKFYYFIYHLIRSFSKQIDHLEYHQRGDTPLVAYFSTLIPLLEWCETNHNAFDKHRCAMAYLHHY